MAKHHGDDYAWRAELGQVALGRHNLDDRLAAKVMVQVIGHNDGDSHVVGTLEYVAWNSDQAQNLPQVTLEYGLSRAKGYIRPHIE